MSENLIKFPSFAPSLSQSPQLLKQSTIFHNNNDSVCKISIHLPDNMLESTLQDQQSKQHQPLKTIINHKYPELLPNHDDNSNCCPIRVYCRLKPIQYQHQHNNILHDNHMLDDGQNCYTFDHVFSRQATQKQLYEKIINRHIEDFFQGKNSTIFAYGQTGSGKTYTMFGQMKSQSGAGLIPRTLQSIFKNNLNGSIITCSMLEIYNEKLMDLFNPLHKSTEQIKLKQYQNSIYLQGLIEVSVEDEQQLLNLIKLGEKGRKIAATSNNDFSSRSHTILFIYRKYYEKGRQNKCKICFIDLAGSEKIRRSGVKGETLEETKKINLSLSCLGNVIHALTNNFSTHIPYRNSKLTRILKDSLNGETNTSIITTCSSHKNDLNETISTIKFAVRAKKIKNKKKLDKEQISMEQIVIKLKQQLAQTKKQLNYYKKKKQEQQQQQSINDCNYIDIPEENIIKQPIKSLKNILHPTLSRKFIKQFNCSQSQSIKINSIHTDSIRF